jgi:putative zinc finger protein
MGVSCEEVWREVSNYLDNDIDPRLRAALEEHFRGCKHCTAVLDGTRNIVTLYGDQQMFELPMGFSQRLHRRISERVARPRGTAFGWMVAVAASLLVVGVFELGSSAAFTQPELRSELADPATKRIPAEMLVVVTTDGKTFHGGTGCPYMHDRSKERLITATEAIREGYTPCTRCMRKYLSATLLAPDLHWGIANEIAGFQAAH